MVIMSAMVNDFGRAWLGQVSRGLLSWSGGWWHALSVGAQLMVLAFSPSSYGPASRRNALREIYAAAGPSLPAFIILMALFNVVVIRIVVVTAFTYGLSSLALNALVRVLVLELIPLVAALYVAVNYSLPGGSELRRMHLDGRLARMRRSGVRPLSRMVLPRVLGGVFAVILMAAIGCMISLVLAYVAVYGFNLAGLPSYNRAVGRIFEPAVTLIFCLKTALFAATVALLPITYALRQQRWPGSYGSAELRGLIHMFVLMLAVELISLLGNYY